MGAVTLIEAAALIGTTPDNLRGAIKRGSLKAVKHGRDWWIEPKEVERYRATNRRASRCPLCPWQGNIGVKAHALVVHGIEG